MEVQTVHLMSATGDQGKIEITSLEDEKRFEDLSNVLQPAHVLEGPFSTETERLLVFPNQATYLIFINLWNSGWRKK